MHIERPIKRQENTAERGAMNQSTPFTLRSRPATEEGKTERPRSTQLPKAVFGGSLKRLRVLNFPLAVALVGLVAVAVATAQTDANFHRLWKPVADEVYLQEIGEKIMTDLPVSSVAIFDKTVHAAVGGVIKVMV